MLPRLIMVLAGLALILVGVQGPLLSLLGEPAMAVVTDVVRDSTDDVTEYQYTVKYEFRVKGETVTGRYTTTRTYNVANLPRSESRIAIRYLPFMPGVSAPVSRTGLSWSTPVAIALGALIIWLGAAGRVKQETAVNSCSSKV